MRIQLSFWFPLFLMPRIITHGPGLWKFLSSPRININSLMDPYSNSFIWFHSMHHGQDATPWSLCVFSVLSLNPSQSQFFGFKLLLEFGRIFGRDSPSAMFFRIFDIQEDIYRFKQGTLSVSDYFTQLEVFWDELESYRRSFLFLAPFPVHMEMLLLSKNIMLKIM